MNADNMLSVKKMALHGMKDSRWKTQDKIVQYKGLIGLYLRDKEVLGQDKIIAEKKYVTSITMMKKAIAEDHQLLDNAINGDRQKLRNALSEKRSLQLAYQRLKPHVIIENLQQATFNNRKKLDLMRFRLARKEEQLINHKLEVSVLEDRIKYEDTGKLPVEIRAGIITGLVQDAILLKEAAITVNLTYRRITHLMHRDAIYYDAMLKSVSRDCEKQHECMKDLVVMGQLATENLDDRHEEFIKVEQMVMRDMKSRARTVVEMEDKYALFGSQIRTLIRRDSDLNMIPTSTPSTDELAIMEEVENINNVFNLFKNTILITNYTRILPCLKEQERQQLRLQELVQNALARKVSLRSKYHHAKKMSTFLVSSVSDNLEEYKRGKKEYLAEIQKENDRKQILKDFLNNRTKLIVQIRTTLQLLTQNCKVLIPRSATFDTNDNVGFNDYINISSDPYSLIDNLAVKLNFLVRTAPEITERQTVDCDRCMLGLTAARCTEAGVPQFAKQQESLLEGMEIEIDAGVLTRADIKHKSADIVKMNLKTEDEMAAASAKK